MKNTNLLKKFENLSLDSLKIELKKVGAVKSSLEQALHAKNVELDQVQATLKEQQTVTQKVVEQIVNELLPNLDFAKVESLKRIFTHESNFVESDWKNNYNREKESILKMAMSIAAERKVNFKPENFAAVRRPFHEAQMRLQQLTSRKDVLEFYSVQALSVDISKYQDLKERQFGTNEYSAGPFGWQYWRDKFVVWRLLNKYSVKNFNDLNPILESSETDLNQLESQINHWRKEFEYWNELENLRKRYDSIDEQTLEHLRLLLRDALWRLDEPFNQNNPELAQISKRISANKRELLNIENKINKIELELNELIEQIDENNFIFEGLQAIHKRRKTAFENNNSVTSETTSNNSISWTSSFSNDETRSDLSTFDQNQDFAFGGNADFAGGGSGGGWENYS